MANHASGPPVGCVDRRPATSASGCRLGRCRLRSRRGHRSAHQLLRRDLQCRCAAAATQPRSAAAAGVDQTLLAGFARGAGYPAPGRLERPAGHRAGPDGRDGRPMGSGPLSVDREGGGQAPFHLARPMTADQLTTHLSARRPDRGEAPDDPGRRWSACTSRPSARPISDTHLPHHRAHRLDCGGCRTSSAADRLVGSVRHPRAPIRRRRRPPRASPRR